jgi:hypothetical protein
MITIKLQVDNMTNLHITKRHHKHGFGFEEMIIKTLTYGRQNDTERKGMSSTASEINVVKRNNSK